MAERSSSSATRRQKSGDQAVGNFYIDQEIGIGSFAQVYSGRHKATGALVAIKAVELARLNKKLKESLYGEIQILKALRHPHIVALHDCVESATHINLIMEYCELGDLSLFIKRRDKLSTNPATDNIARKYPSAPNSGLNEVIIRHFLKQLASALKFLRQGNLVHRDVKPQNLLLLPSPQFRETSRSSKQILTASQDSLTPATGLSSLPMLKLADFGFARVLPSTSLAETLCGSPLYMAPEILRYERYDAKADLWSVGAVLYEMATGRPPFRASNHVELVRKIEATEDQIRFPRDTVVSSEMKSLIRALLKRKPVERLSYENFLDHPVVVNPIPGLVGDDIPKTGRRASKDLRIAVGTEDAQILSAKSSSFRRYHGTDSEAHDGAPSPSPNPRRPSPLATPTEQANPFEQPLAAARFGVGPGHEPAEGLGIRRPVVQPSSSAPARPPMYVERRARGLSHASAKTTARESTPAAWSGGRPTRRIDTRAAQAEQERAAQDVAFERDYVVVEKKHVEVNALADQLAAARGEMSKPGSMANRGTQQQEAPPSSAGAVLSSPSRNMQIATGRDHYRQASYDRAYSGSPGSATSVLSKAIQDASLRLFGYRVTPNPLGKGPSPPQVYSPFPAYPTPMASVGLLGDGKQSTPMDEDSRVAQCIEDLATRSDVVYGFAEVKYKQLVPLAPSVEHALGGKPTDQLGSAEEDNDGLTAEAKLLLSEEALVLYVKALSLLAKSMDIASLWWTRKSRTESSGGHSATREVAYQHMGMRINSAVQWIRTRFNEVLEKAEMIRLKLVEAQNLLPEDHASHPSNHGAETKMASGPSADGIFLTPGISAEKLMYERAVEMSRNAAINEIANEDLPGCELSYITAIRMLEAVLDNDDELPKRRVSGASKDDKLAGREDLTGGDMDAEDQQVVQKMIQMVTTRLGLVRKKTQAIAAVAKAQQRQQQSLRRRSGG